MELDRDEVTERVKGMPKNDALDIIDKDIYELKEKYEKNLEILNDVRKEREAGPDKNLAKLLADSTDIDPDFLSEKFNLNYEPVSFEQVLLEKYNRKKDDKLLSTLSLYWRREFDCDLVTHSIIKEEVDAGNESKKYTLLYEVKANANTYEIIEETVNLRKADILAKEEIEIESFIKNIIKDYKKWKPVQDPHQKKLSRYKKKLVREQKLTSLKDILANK